MTPTRQRTFGAGSFGVTAGRQSLGKPTAAYPGAIATDSDLMIAVDRQQTRLALPLNTTDTSMTVVDPSVIVAYCLLTIDAETVKTTGPPVGNVVPISRGFDGTTAAVHLASAVVSGFVDAYHHNRLVAEVEAIQQTLGPNLGNIASTSQTVSTAFNFPAQTPGGNLVVGNNSITITPVPKGVNGTNQYHYLYISGGTGASEAVLITGGSAVSGAASGTLIINCANAHSGAWTIRTATAGIQEAIYFLPGVNGEVYIPAGISTTYATITIPGSLTASVSLRGAGGGASTISTSYTGGPVISMLNPHWTFLVDFGITGPSTGSNFAISVATAWNSTIQRVKITNVANGISFTGAFELNVVRDVEIDLPGGGTGIYVNASSSGEAGGTFERIFVQGNGTTAGSIGFNIVSGVGAWLRRTYTNGVSTGLLVNPGNGQTVGVLDLQSALFDGFNSNSAYGIHLSPSAGGTINTIRASDSGAGGFIYGIVMDGGGTQIDYVFSGFEAMGNSNIGIILNTGKNCIFQNCFVEGNGGNSNPGFEATSVTNLQIRGGVYAAGSYGNASNTQTAGIAIGSSTNVLIDGAVVAPNIGGATITVGTSTGVVIRNCIGYNPVGQSPVTVGASPFTYMAGTSPEIVYVQGGTVSQITINLRPIVNAAIPVGQSVIIPLAPNESIVVTYSAVPTMFRDVQ